MSDTYKIGTVVCLNSSPDVPMTVTGYGDRNGYNNPVVQVAWLSAKLTGCSFEIDNQAVQLYKGEI
tara:strand:+ start:444 stop:641 length:198 start_codon:yes stop_codon:yes gene_type:complete